ncbi:MAG: hypothetical protein IPJ00_09420 [Saprospirales bacterium]|nr:hypothetical protein [Saprospirales bacterium]
MRSYDSSGDVWEVHPLSPGNNVSISYPAVYHDKLFFEAQISGPGRELWVYDNLADTSALIADLVPGNEGSSPAYLTVFNDKLYFQATTDDYGTELWEYNETDTSQTLQIYADIRPNEPSANPSYLTVFNGKLYFSADNGDKGDEIWSLAPCLNIFVTTISESEEGAGDGSINLTVEGGTPPYTFQWSNGSATEDLSGLPGGDYGVTVTDDLGCIAQLAAVVLTATGVGEAATSEALSISPNPTDGQVILEFFEQGSRCRGRPGAGVLWGRWLGVWSGTFCWRKQAILDLSELPAGFMGWWWKEGGGVFWGRWSRWGVGGRCPRQRPLLNMYEKRKGSSPVWTTAFNSIIFPSFS